MLNIRGRIKGRKTENKERNEHYDNLDRPINALISMTVTREIEVTFDRKMTVREWLKIGEENEYPPELEKEFLDKIELVEAEYKKKVKETSREVSCLSFNHATDGQMPSCEVHTNYELNGIMINGEDISDPYNEKEFLKAEYSDPPLQY